MRAAARAAVLATAALLAAPCPARAEDSDADLALKLSNPVAALISVPLQANYDCCFGPLNGARYTLNVQPVIPFTLNPEWNLIVRTIVPVIQQNRTSPTTGDASGLGDTTQSFFFSPHSSGGLIWAVGPALLWPTGSSELGSRKWGAGPTVLVLEQRRGFTYGLLANHIWSYADAGGQNRPSVSSTFIQPFFSWTSPSATTVGINAESSYNWQDGQWSIPINLSVKHVYRFGTQRVAFDAGVRVYAARDAVKPADPAWGLRFTTTFLFPR